MPSVSCTRHPFPSRRATVLALHLFLHLLILLPWLNPALAKVPRGGAPEGSIVNATGDAQIRLIETSDWLTAEIAQDLLAGDNLRTGPLGTMALLFIDRTRIRVQRNSVLTVKAVAGKGGGDTVLRLERGGTWSRAVSGGTGVRIETPSATAAIRGTDWSLTVDDKGSSRLIVLDGEVLLENPYGRVSVRRGEIALAEIGKAPTKTILVNPRDREQQVYDLSLVQAMTFFKLSGYPVEAARQALSRIEAVPPSERNGMQWLEMAELALDLGDVEEARRALQALDAAGQPDGGRACLAAAFASFFAYDFDHAEQYFAEAAAKLPPPAALTARIGQSATLLKLRRTVPARELIERMRQDDGDEPRFLLFEIVLTAFAGDLPAAADQARSLSLRFPTDPAFPAAEGVAAILLGRPEQALAAAEKTLFLDPGSSIGHQILAEYRRFSLGNSELAAETVRQGLDHNDRDGVLWSQLAWISMLMDESRMAEEMFQRALALNPNIVNCLANYAILLLSQERLGEAASRLADIERIDPGRDFTMLLAGRLDLQSDDIARAEQNLLKATALNPAFADSSTILAQAYYQQGEPALARQALDNAARMDENDPLIPLIGSVIAADQAQADLAVAYAREAIRLYRQRRGEGITGLASTRGGNNTLGAAFQDLGLTAWADYFNDLSFDPSSAESHYAQALRPGQGFASVVQGLLLEPLSVSARNRVVYFYRRPFIDSEIGTSLAWSGNGTGYGGDTSIQGFTRSPKPMSYALSFTGDHSPQDRDHADLRQTGYIGALGAELTPHDGLVLDVEGTGVTRELPGTLALPDPDDESDSRTLSAGLGYSHHFSGRNVAFGRIMYQDGRTTLTNADPLGTSLTSLDYSLVHFFGPELTRMFYEAGLQDRTDPADPNAPLLSVGGPGPYLVNTIPPWLDTKDFSLLRVEERALSLHARHLFTLGNVDFTYGAEYRSFRQETVGDFILLAQRDPGTGLVVGEGGAIPFPFGDPVPVHFDATRYGGAGSAYLDGLWRVNAKFWLSGSLFAEHSDMEGYPPLNRLDPRIGAAWQVTDHDWLRLAFREDISPTTRYSLAPVATIGLMADTSLLATDGRVATSIARWDREWCPHFFSGVELRRQDITAFRTTVPDTFLYYSAEEGRIDQASLAANLWLRGGFGLFAVAVFRDTEDVSAGPAQGNALPLIPDQELTTGVVWIHPLQIRASLALRLVGERPADEYGTAMLGSFQSLDLGVSWQPLAKHLELGLAVTNLFNEEYETGQDMPAAERRIALTARWRF